MLDSKDSLLQHIINVIQDCRRIITDIDLSKPDAIDFKELERYRKDAIDLRNMIAAKMPDHSFAKYASDVLTEYINATTTALPSHKVYWEGKYLIIEDPVSQDKYIVLRFVTQFGNDDINRKDRVFVKDYNKRDIQEPHGYNQAIDEGKTMLDRYKYIRVMEVNAITGWQILKHLRVTK